MIRGIFSLLMLMIGAPLYCADQGAGASKGNTPPERRTSLLSTSGAVAHMSGLRNRKRSNADEQKVDLIKTLLSVSPPTDSNKSFLLTVKDEGAITNFCPHGLPSQDKCPICG